MKAVSKIFAFAAVTAALVLTGCSDLNSSSNNNDTEKSAATEITIAYVENYYQSEGASADSIECYTSGASYSESNNLYTGTGWIVDITPTDAVNLGESGVYKVVNIINVVDDDETAYTTMGTDTVTVTVSDGNLSFTSDAIELYTCVNGDSKTDTGKSVKITCSDVAYSE